jgi:hypothetical protein
MRTFRLRAILERLKRDAEFLAFSICEIKLFERCVCAASR